MSKIRMITKDEINGLEKKLKRFSCIVQATKNHQKENYNMKLIEISYREFGEIVDFNTSNQDNLQIWVKWPKSRHVNYSYQDMPIEIIEYISKDHPSQLKLLK